MKTNDSEGNRFADGTWALELIAEDTGGQAHYVGLVKREGTCVCRLSIRAAVGELAQAQAELQAKAEAWIAEYLSRDHSGHTKWDEL